MSTTIARTPEEIRVVLDTLAGEHLPTRKVFVGAAMFCVFGGVIAPVLLTWAIAARGLDLVEDLESLIYIIMGPPLAFSLLQVAMARYVVDDSYIACFTPIRFGSWTMVRAEIERIEVSIGPTGMALVLHSILMSRKTMPLRKRYSDRFLRMYPELRKAKLQVSAEERARKRRAKVMTIALLVIVAAALGLLVVMFVQR